MKLGEVDQRAFFVMKNNGKKVIMSREIQ